MEDKNTQFIIPDANELSMKIMCELPEDGMNETYYALRLVMEMIEAMKVPAELEHPCEDCCECDDIPDDCGEEEDDDTSHHFEIEIEAYGVKDLRDQLSDLYSYTYSKHFQHDIKVFNSMEYDSETGITKGEPKESV